MIFAPARLIGLAFLLGLVAAPAADAVDIAPHRALYSLTLAQTKSASGVVAASGAMVYEWGETCEGWTVQQRFRLRLEYAEQDNVDVSSSLVTWESKDGLRYRFNERRLRNGDLDEEIKGEAKLDGPGKGGSAEFTKPETATLTLPPGTIFPTAHTLLLIQHAQAGDQLISRKVFDGATVDNAGQITAVIGPGLKPNASNANEKLPKSPLLERPSWRMRLAFFPADSKQEQPDYELGMRLLDNGVSQDMTLDYGDYIIRAKLDDIEALPRPSC
jgi:EipB-like